MSVDRKARSVPRRRGLRIVVIASLLLVGLALFAVGLVFRYPFAVGKWMQRRALASAGFEQQQLDEDLAFFAAGEGPPLLFLHGVGEQAGAWARVAPGFTDRYRVYIPDLPGHGESEPVAGDLPMATIVAGAERILATATEERPAVVVGLSMGAWIATLLAERHPERVERLVLVAGGALPGEAADISLQPETREEAASLIEKIRHPDSPAVPDHVLDALVRRGQTGPIARLSRDTDGLVAHLLDETRVAAIGVPTDLLYGVADQMFPPSYGRRLEALLSASRLSIVEPCGHAMTAECPERLATELRRILAAPAPEPKPTATEPKPAQDPEESSS